MLKLAISLAAIAVCYVQAENTYFLYTKSNPLSPQTINDIATLPEEFESTDPTIILIHGYGGSARAAFNTLTTEAILRLRESGYNVIVVDWEKDASYSYAAASASVPSVANDLEAFIRRLSTGDPPPLVVSELHLVGFGLGAHVAGITSRQLSTLGVVGRITGLDPSGSGWSNNPIRLNSRDARYVEVIHTDGSGLLANGIGTAIGHINFYANGGSNQPGCLSHSCNHNRAYELFAASMFNAQLVGYPCSSSVQLNLNKCRGNPLRIGGTDLFKRGVSNVYRVNTKRSYPF